MNSKAIGKICLLGLSSFIAQFALVVVIAVVNNTLKVKGGESVYGSDIPVSAMGVVMKVSQVLTSVLLGIATGILPVISYNYGSGRYDRVKKLLKNALIASTTVMVVVLVPAVLILGTVGDVTTVLWAGPISDSVASIITLVVCWKKTFRKEKKVK